MGNDHDSFTGGYDGAVDVEREWDFVTVSWNHCFDHDKASLVGSTCDVRFEQACRPRPVPLRPRPCPGGPSAPSR